MLLSKEEKAARGKRNVKKIAAVTGWLKKGPPELIRDPAKDEFIRLSEAYDQILEEYKRLRGHVEHLEREYNEGKMLDFFRRYSKLKGMIKRTSMHLKLAEMAGADANKKDESSTVKGLGGAVGGLLQGTREFAKKAEQARKREERLQNQTSEELQQENRKLEESIKDMRRRINMITDLIGNLENQYTDSKRFFPVRRYQMMKIMVKNITHNHLIRDNV